MLARRGRDDDKHLARELLETAIDRYATYGMPRHLEMAEAQLKAL